MTRSVLLPIAIASLAIAGCRAAPKAAASARAAVDRPPQAIVLTDQTRIWECAHCGMDYDRPGVCSMDDNELVPMRVSYLCPADAKPVTKAGRCPRCEANARVVKTALAPELSRELTGR